MPDKYQNKYRIKSTRMQNWDYRWNGKYFITICTYKMQHLFGEIIDQKLEISNVGVLADVFWHEIKNHTDNIELDAFVVMPNHIHGVLIIDNPFRIDAEGNQITPSDSGNIPGEMQNDLGNSENDFGNSKNNAGNNLGNSENDARNDSKNPWDLECRTDRACQDTNETNTESTRSTARACPGSTPPHGPTLPPGAHRFQNIGKKSLSSIIGSYKSAVTKHAHRLGYYMEWQERFHDHLIRNDAEYNRIRNYIHNNPKKWNNDKFNQK